MTGFHVHRVLNGDLITGENTFKENSTVYIDEIVNNLNEAQIPFSSTYGVSSLPLFCHLRPSLLHFTPIMPHTQFIFYFLHLTCMDLT